MSGYSVFDPANDELIAHTDAIMATLEKFSPAVRLQLAEIFVAGLLEDVRISVRRIPRPNDPDAP